MYDKENPLYSGTKFVGQFIGAIYNATVWYINTCLHKPLAAIPGLFAIGSLWMGLNLMQVNTPPNYDPALQSTPPGISTSTYPAPPTVISVYNHTKATDPLIRQVFLPIIRK